jgi:hypothetical protein
VACPDGTHTTTAGTTAVDSTACDNLDPGYYYTGVPGVFPAQVNSANVLVCTKGYYCDGATAIDTAALTTEKGRTQCTTGTTTAAAATTNIAAANCNTLLPKYYHTGADAAVTAQTIRLCPDNAYCPGGAGFTYSATATSGISECPGYTCTKASATTSPAVCAAQTATTPNGGSGTTAPAQSSVAGCDNLDAGFYYLPGVTKTISATTILPCPVDNWCDGSARITLLSATTGISGTCPTAGSTSPAGSDAAEDCVLEKGYYYTGIGGVLNDNTIQPCKPGFYCDAPSSGDFTINTTPQGATACAASTTCIGTSCQASSDCV